MKFFNESAIQSLQQGTKIKDRYANNTSWSVWFLMPKDLMYSFHYTHMKRAHQIVLLSESCNGDVMVDFTVEYHAHKNPRLASWIEITDSTPRRLRHVTLIRKQSMYSFHYIHMKRTLLICLLFRIVGWKRESLVSEKGKLTCFNLRILLRQHVSNCSYSHVRDDPVFSFHFFIKMERAQLCFRVFRNVVALQPKKK